MSPGWLWLSLGVTLLLLLLFVCALLLRSNFAYRREVTYMREQLDRFAERDTGGQLLLVTSSPELRGLLTAVNGLLARARQSAADYTRTERAMRKMLANVSHDLKTPLTVVLGYAEALARDADMPASERERLLGQVHRKALDVLELMNKFFDLAKLESGDTDLPLTKLDAGELCRHSILAYYDILAARGFEVDIDIPERPIYVYANAEALVRILDNLLSNALRYGSSGLYLGLSVREQGDQVWIAVTDKGPGIRETERDRVFERLYTLEDSRNREVQGSGLGLTITKRLVEKLNGEIVLDSVPGVQTRFTVKLRRIGAPAGT